MMDSIKISIVTVTFNAEKSIENTIQSVLKQTYSNIEYIVIDGCSSDNTLDVIKQYANDIDKLLVERDSGVYDAMNKSLSIATGDFIIFMNAGDCFVKNFTIEGIVNRINELDCIYYGDVLVTDEEHKHVRFYGGVFDKFKLCMCNICHQSILYPRLVYAKYKYNLKYYIFADYYYNIIVMGNYKYVYIDTIVCYFDSNGISARCRDSFYEDKSNIIYKNLGVICYLYFQLRTKINPGKWLRKIL